MTPYLDADGHEVVVGETSSLFSEPVACWQFVGLKAQYFGPCKMWWPGYLPDLPDDYDTTDEIAFEG